MKNKLLTGRNLTLAAIITAFGLGATVAILQPKHKGMEELRYLAGCDNKIEEIENLEERRKSRANIRLDELRQLYQNDMKALQERNDSNFNYETDAVNHLLGNEDEVWSAFYQTESNNNKVDCEDIAIHNAVVDGTFRFLALYDINLSDDNENPIFTNHAVNFGEKDDKFYVTGIGSDYHDPQFDSISDIAIHFGARRAAIWAPIEEEDWIEYAGNVKGKSKVIGFYDLSDRVNNPEFGLHLEETKEEL